MDMKAVLQRIERRLSKLGKTAAGASREATGSPDLIRNWKRAVKEGKSPGASTVTIGKLAVVLDTNVLWLMEEIGHEEGRDLSSTPIDVPLLATVSAGEMMRDDLFDEAIETLSITKLPPGDWFALKVEGDSMDRISPPDSIILVNRKDRRLVANACYIIANQYGEASYKRYRPNPDRFEPVSNNPAHEPIFPDNEVPVIGRVRRTMLEM